jgi:hypothetical protein
LQNWYTQRHDARQEGIGRILTSGGDKRVFAMFVQGGGINKNFKLTTSATADPKTSLFVWLVADGWCWFVLREKYCWLVAGG